MKLSSLFRLGGAAILLAETLFAFGNLSYFLPVEQFSGAVTIWVSMFGHAFLALGLCALYARQAQQGSWLGLASFVLLLWGNMYSVGSDAVRMGVAQGAFTLEQVAQVTAYGIADSIFSWVWVLGTVTLGVSVYRAGVFPKYAGLLFVLLGVVESLTGPLAVTRPVFMLIAFAAWVWPGLLLLTGREPAAMKAAPAASG